jgi:hypothetical protein
MAFFWLAFLPSCSNSQLTLNSVAEAWIELSQYSPIVSSKENPLSLKLFKAVSAFISSAVGDMLLSMIV